MQIDTDIYIDRQQGDFISLLPLSKNEESRLKRRQSPNSNILYLLMYVMVM
jgi:hypothetical protein